MHLLYGSECKTQEIVNVHTLYQQNYDRAIGASCACNNRQHTHGSVEYIERWLFEYFGRTVILRYAGTHNQNTIYGFDWNDYSA